MPSQLTSPLFHRFDLLEPLLAGRSALFNAVGSATGAARALTAAAAAARAAGLAGAGLTRIHAIKIACASGTAAGGSAAAAAAAVGAADAPWRDEEAALLWMDGQHELALGLAGALVGVPHMRQGSNGVKRTAALLSCLGGWLAERHAESTDCIRSQHLEKAVALLSQAKATSQGGADATYDDALCHAHFQLAQFLDNIHRGCVFCAPAFLVSALAEVARAGQVRGARDLCRLEPRTAAAGEHAHGAGTQSG